MKTFSVNFFSENIDFHFQYEKFVNKLLEKIANDHQAKIDTLNVIFCSDTYILGINKQYLNHDYYTDVITFDNSEDEQIVSDIFISVDRAREHAIAFKIEPEQEIMRLIIHAFLHLLGHSDKKTKEKKEMSEKEDMYLDFFCSIK